MSSEPARAAAIPRPAVERFAFWAILILTLVLCCITGLITPYLMLLVGLAAWFTYLVRGRLPQAYDDLAARNFLAVFVVLGIVFSFAARQLNEPLYVFNFVMLLLYAPIADIMRRGAATGAPQRIAALALLGTGLAFLTVAVSALQGTFRPAGLYLGPIVLSNAAMALGFIALIGAVGTQSRRSWVYFAGPLLAIATALLTQSRGPLLGIPALVVLVTVFFWFGRFRGWRLFPVIVAAAVAAVGGLVALLAGSRTGRLLDILSEALRGGSTSDQSSNIRLMLYDAAQKAFLDSPWIGHGWARLMQSIMPYIAPENVQYTRDLPQLHNDVLNFAVAGGVVGVAAYLAIIATPLIAVLRSPRDSLWFARLYGVSAMSVVYVFGGLTDLMFGHEFHTALFICLSAILLNYCRDAPEPTARR